MEPMDTDEVMIDKSPVSDIHDYDISSNQIMAANVKGATMSLKAQNGAATSAKPTDNKLPEQLMTVLSNLYLNAVKRLCLNNPPRCAIDLAHCLQQHYRAILPDAPNYIQAKNLRSTLSQKRYICFLENALDMCQRNEFPGDGIWMKLIDLMLGINAKESTDVKLQLVYNKTMELFELIVGCFPPCWRTMRPYYVNFLQRPITHKEINNKSKDANTASSKILNLIFDLLECTLEECSAEELLSSVYADINISHSPVKATPTSPALLDLSQDSEQQSMNMTEMMNEYDWQDEICLQQFELLQPGQRLARIFHVLELMLKILENDFVMWILHHHKKTKEWIFCNENMPLIVSAFEMSLYVRVSATVKQLFELFAKGVNKGLSKKRLQLLERFITLIMEASNTADLENTVIGVKYPYLGKATKQLIQEFFKIFKAHNTTHIGSYIETVPLLRIPYLRYQFIDHFLQLFYFPSNEELTPKKIAYDMVKKRWHKYQPNAAITNPMEDLSREAYLALTLDALRAYCDWHGSSLFVRYIINKQPVGRLQTTTDTVHRWPTVSGSMLVLNNMEKDIVELEQLLKIKVRVANPKVDLPLADICIDDEIISKYRSDLKFVMILHEFLPKHAAAHTDVDFSAWLAYLQEFAGQTTALNMPE